MNATTCPCLTALISELLLDNYGTLGASGMSTWNWPEDLDYPALESQAARLSESERVEFAAGEADGVDKLVERYSIEDLNEFLAEVFDGKYSLNFSPMFDRPVIAPTSAPETLSASDLRPGVRLDFDQPT